MRYLKFAVPVLIAILVVVMVSLLPPKVDVTRPAAREVAEVLAVSGQIHGRRESSVAPEITGVLEELAVEEGAHVEAGDLLARLDAAVRGAEVEQARDAVAVAEAALAQASRPPLASEVERVEAETRRAVETAEAELKTAREQLREAEYGPRLETEQQAAAELEVLRAELDQARRDLARQRKLFQEGAVPRTELERGETAFEVARGQVERAEARLRELEKGTRPEEVARARAQVQAAQASLQGAAASREAQLQNLRDQPRPEDVALARAQLEQAREQLEVAQARLAQTELRAPYAGLVAERLLREGDVAGPSQPVFTVVSTPGYEIRADVDEAERGRVEVGQPAEVTSDAFPGQPFEARVREVGPRVDTVQGTFEVRLEPVESPDWLVPGHTVDVSLFLSPRQERLLVPLEAVQMTGDTSSVLVVSAGRVERREVGLGPPTREGFPVHDGLSPDDLVIVGANRPEPGTRVRTSRRN